LNPDPANSFWRLAADPAGIVWAPSGLAWWLTWGLPDTGFSVQMSASLAGPWTNFVPTYISPGANSKSAAIPIANLPSASVGFFRMLNPNP
jgi:hypothetical protein